MATNFAQVIAFLTGPTIAHILDWIPAWNNLTPQAKQFLSLVLTAGGSYLAYWLTSNVNAATEATYDPLIGVALTLASFLVAQYWHKATKASTTPPAQG